MWWPTALTTLLGYGRSRHGTNTRSICMRASLTTLYHFGPAFRSINKSACVQQESQIIKPTSSTLPTWVHRFPRLLGFAFGTPASASPVDYVSNALRPSFPLAHPTNQTIHRGHTRPPQTQHDDAYPAKTLRRTSACRIDRAILPSS